MKNALGQKATRGWLPIDTAPRDGSTVLLRVPTLYGKWNKTLPLAGRWEERDQPTSGFWTIFNADEAVQRVEATHWMPLPDEPLTATQDHQEILLYMAEKLKAENGDWFCSGCGARISMNARHACPGRERESKRIS